MDGEHRSFDVTLEAEQTIVAVPAAEPEFSAWEAGASFGYGVKGHGDDPAMLAYRVDIGHRWRHVNFGGFVEYGSISAKQACGTGLPGPTPTSSYDFGTRNQFTSCYYVMPGVQLNVHVLPGRRWDPWVGVTPGFRLGEIAYTPYNALGMSSVPTSYFQPGILTDVRVGVDYHSKPTAMGWAVGAFADLQVMFVGQEVPNNDGNGHNTSPYVSVLGGLHSTLTF
jgi:hypothetical protein